MGISKWVYIPSLTLTTIAFQDTRNTTNGGLFWKWQIPGFRGRFSSSSYLRGNEYMFAAYNTLIRMFHGYFCALFS
jgi:hypothetical protein